MLYEMMGLPTSRVCIHNLKRYLENGPPLNPAPGCSEKVDFQVCPSFVATHRYEVTV